MRKHNMRLVILNNTSMLMAERHGMHFYAGIVKLPRGTDSWYSARPSNSPLLRAKKNLREQISNFRFARRDVSEKLVRTTPGYFVKELARRSERLILEEKTPLTMQRHVGVEIEFLSSLSQKDIRRKLIKAGMSKFVNLTTDGSVSGDSDGSDCDGSCRDNCECSSVEEFHHNTEMQCDRYNRHYGNGEETWEVREDCDECDMEILEDCDCGGTEIAPDGTETKLCDGHSACVGHCPGHTYDPDTECTCECTCSSESGHELRVIAPQHAIKSVIETVCKVLVQDCSAKVNSTCGLHVHLDMRHRDHKKAFRNLVLSQKLLYRLVPQSRERNTYCKPTENSSFDVEAGRGRYKGINPESFHEHKTIEVRLHSGTVNATKINNWIDLLVRIATAKEFNGSVGTLKELKTKIRIPAELTQYLNSRIQKFHADEYAQEVA